MGGGGLKQLRAKQKQTECLREAFTRVQGRGGCKGAGPPCVRKFAFCKLNSILSRPLWSKFTEIYDLGVTRAAKFCELKDIKSGPFWSKLTELYDLGVARGQPFFS